MSWFWFCLRRNSVWLALVVASFCVVYFIVDLGQEPAANRMYVIPNSVSSNTTEGSGEYRVKEGSDMEELSKRLYGEVRVLCWVLTSPNNTREQRAVAETWGRRCNTLVFASTKENKSLGVVALPVKEGRNELWGKTKEALKHVWREHANATDWFMKADDDTFVFVENLRYLLSAYSPSEPVWFGHRFRRIWPQGYMSGAQCLANVGVYAGDSRDWRGRERFLPFEPEQHVAPSEKPPDPKYWYTGATVYPINYGLNCCSDTPISFHYIMPTRMYEIEYLVYRARTVGGLAPNPDFPPKPPPTANKTSQIKS